MAKNGHYEVPRRTARLVFEGTDYDGAEVVCRLDVPLQMFFDFQRMVGQSDDPDVIEQAFRRFSDDVLMEWNLTDAGKPIPATAEGFLAQPPAFAMLILTKWIEGVGAVSVPLAPASAGSEPVTTLSQRN